MNASSLTTLIASFMRLHELRCHSGGKKLSHTTLSRWQRFGALVWNDLKGIPFYCCEGYYDATGTFKKRNESKRLLFLPPLEGYTQAELLLHITKLQRMLHETRVKVSRGLEINDEMPLLDPKDRMYIYSGGKPFVGFHEPRQSDVANILPSMLNLAKKFLETPASIPAEVHAEIDPIPDGFGADCYDVRTGKWQEGALRKRFFEHMHRNDEVAAAASEAAFLSQCARPKKAAKPLPMPYLIEGRLVQEVDAVYEPASKPLLLMYHARGGSEDDDDDDGVEDVEDVEDVQGGDDDASVRATAEEADAPCLLPAPLPRPEEELSESFDPPREQSKAWCASTLVCKRQPVQHAIAPFAISRRQTYLSAEQLAEFEEALRSTRDEFDKKGDEQRLRSASRIEAVQDRAKRTYASINKAMQAVEDHRDNHEGFDVESEPGSSYTRLTAASTNLENEMLAARRYYATEETMIAGVAKIAEADLAVARDRALADVEHVFMTIASDAKEEAKARCHRQMELGFQRVIDAVKQQEGVDDEAAHAVAQGVWQDMIRKRKRENGEEDENETR